MNGRHWALAIAIGAIFGAAASRFAVNDSDLFWHLASARWMVEHGRLLTTDEFSSTVRGASVPVHQWLGELALWGAYAAGSWWGVLVLRVVAVTVLATVVARATIARASRPLLGALAVVPGLALSRFVWGDRPELLGLVAFAAFLPLALALRGGDRRAGVALVPLMALWANLHGGFVVGVALLVALAIESALFDRARARVVALWSSLAIAATFVNPLGPAVYATPAYHFTDPPRFIQEWAVPDVTTFPGMLWAIALLGMFALATLRPSARTSDVALLAPLAFLSLSAVRQMPLVALAAGPFLADRLSALAASRVGAARAPMREPRAILVAFAAVLLAASLATAPREPDLSSYPTGALASLRDTPGTLFNDYDWGGFLIWSASEHPVFVDGRLVPYLPDTIADYRRAIGAHEAWHDVLDRYRVDVVLVRPAAALAVRLREAGWATVYADDVAVLLRRP